MWLLREGHHTTLRYSCQKNIELKSDSASRSNRTFQENQGKGNMGPSGKLFRANNPFPQQIHYKFNNKNNKRKESKPKRLPTILS